MPESPIRIGISTCLLGESVRYDGGHKHDRFLTETFGPFVEWVPVCPEVELGLGIPREPIHLVARDEGVGIVGVKTGKDITGPMQRYAQKRASSLAKLDLAGYVLKKGSPSCGLERVKVYRAKQPTRDGRGMFAAALLERFRSLPVEEEGRLHDPRLRENWIERVFAYRRLRDLFQGRWSIGKLVAFHTAHKLTLLAHEPAGYRELGRLVAEPRRFDRRSLRERYEARFMSALKKLATPARHTNVLQHMAGYFRRGLDDASRRELGTLIEDYRNGLLPLVVPITLIRHHARRNGIDYLLGQTYLAPHPKELALRNHV